MLRAASDDELVSLYCEALLADPRVTMSQILDTQRPPGVARVYVPSRISEERRWEYDTSLSDEAAAETTPAEDPDAWIEQERQRRERRVVEIYDPEKAIRTFPRCVITGGPGAGKTTLLRHLAITAAQRSIAGQPSLLPVYVELQSFVRSGLHDLLDFIGSAWEMRYGVPARQARSLLANCLDEGKALLLLDGLDEAAVGETPAATKQSYESVSQAIHTMAAGYPKAAMVVTIRKASYKQRRPLAGFTALEVLDFRFEDVKQFVRNWYSAAVDPYAEEKSADLIERLDAHPRLQTMAANPLLLTLMALAYQDRLELPERRAELFRICIETLFTKRDARREIQRGWEFKAEQKQQLLAVVAWHFHVKRQRYFAEHELLAVIAEFLPSIALPAERNGDILQEIESEQGVLQKQAANWHGFLHLSLQEYFAARYINDHQAYTDLLRHRADPWWEEVLRLCMEIIPDASPFLRQLWPEESPIREDIFYTNALLAGRCLTARPAVRETGLRAQITERLFELVMSAQYSLLRQEAITVLCRIGIFETNSRLVTLLADDRQDVFVRRRITGALGTSGERSLAGDMVRLLSDERLNTFVRWSITDALGTLGEHSVVEDLVQLLADERLHAELRRGIADALGRLVQRSGGLGGIERPVAEDLVQMLADDRLDVFVRRGIADTLGRMAEGSGGLGGIERSVAEDLVRLLADDRMDVDLRRSIADALGRLGERSVAEDLVQLLADERLNVDLRRNIADALGILGEWSVVAGAMVQLLADERQDVFVRRRITGALGTLAEESIRLSEELEGTVAEDLVRLLADERLDADLRWSIADTLGRLAEGSSGLGGSERSVVGDLVRLLPDEQLDVNVRRSIAIALGRLGERAVAARAMVQMLIDDRLDVNVRRSVADALGTLAEEPGRLGGIERPVAEDLVWLLADDRLDADLRWSIADALGRLAERSVTRNLAQLLADEQLDVNVRRAIAIALARLGERAVAARAMVQMLSDDRFGVFARRSIADALATLAEKSVAGDLVKLLSDKQLHLFIRRKIADALGKLAEGSVAGDLVHLLSDKMLEVELRGSIAAALAAYADDNSIVEGLIKALQDEEISDSVYNALWTISRRAGLWIFPMHPTAHTSSVKQSQDQYEIVPWE